MINIRSALLMLFLRQRRKMFLEQRHEVMKTTYTMLYWRSFSHDDRLGEIWGL